MSKNKRPIKNKNNQSAAKLTWLPDKTFEFEFYIPWERVKQTHGQVLKELAKGITLKGFRKGKAPLKIVEKNIDKAKLYEEVIRNLLPETYQEMVKKQSLKPIIPPKIEIISVKEDKDWQFKAVSCERPEIKLGDYQKLIKGELAGSKIWTPDKGDPNKKDEKTPSSEQKIKIVTKALLTNISLKISFLLVEDEVNRMLTQLLDQVNALGITIQQYLKSKGLTQEQLRESFKKQAEESLKLEFILQAIIEERKIKVSQEEVEKMIMAIPEEKIRQAFADPREKAYIASIIAKRKVIDYLISL